MSTTAMHPLAVDYLQRLRRAGHDLPAGRLDDLCAEIESHLAEAIPPGASDADARSVLERLGPPEDIIEAEQPTTAPPTTGRRTWRETAAVGLLLLGGFVFGLGWIAGVALLWTSRVWTLRDKLIGTLIVPGGLAAVLPALVLVGHPTKWLCHAVTARTSTTAVPGPAGCTRVGHAATGPTALGIVLLVIVIAGPILTAIYLSLRAAAASRAA